MTPLDDELRTALGRRADLVSPAADPFEGIERRARGIRRRRGLAAVLGTTAAVAAIALAVPAVIGSTSASRGPVATTPPTSPPAVVVDDARPANAVLWPSGPLGDADLDGAVRTAFASQVGDAPEAVQGDQLWIGASPDGELALGWYQLWSPQSPEAVLVLAYGAPGGPATLGSHQQTSPGPDLAGLADTARGRGTWVAALGAPGTTSLAYAEDGSRFVPVELETRSAVFPRTGPASGTVDAVRFEGAKGRLTVDVGTRGSEPGPSSEPANLVDWPARGAVPAPSLVADAKKAFAMALGRPEDLGDVGYRLLFAGDTDGGLRYVLGQAWFVGEETAYPVGFYTGGEQGSEAFVGRPTADDAQVLAFVPCCSPGTTTDTLVVIPAPAAGQVQYAATDSAWRDVGAGQDHLDGVVLVDRDPRATDDRLRVLDGDGDLDGPYLYEGPVAALLCGLKDCG